MVTRAGKNCRAVILTANKKNGGENRRPTIGVDGTTASATLLFARFWQANVNRGTATVNAGE